MKKIIFSLFALALFSCAKDDIEKDKSVVELTTKEQIANRTELDRYLLEKFTNLYNVDIVYRYSENDISRTFRYVSPPSAEKALEAANFLKYMYYEPYNLITPQGFLQNYSPKQLVFVGSQAYSDVGTRYNGGATNAVKIELLGINHRNFNTNTDSEIMDIDNRVLRLIYHESSHLLEQTKVIPPEYEKLSAADYKGSAWTSSWSGTTYLLSGFISPYASQDLHEDFVEMIARYIIYYQKNQCGCETTDSTLDTDGDGLNDTEYATWKTATERRGNIWEEQLSLADGRNNTSADYTGKEILERKIEIVKNYLQNEWNISLDALREEIHRRHANLSNKDFSQFEW
ncbi:MAG: putative zinc-binding metallopeptidase [Capnocytophaga sp.]|nr:putative zinc-binding metallopeptidase [Capnocytophaga sp.]